MSKYLQIIEACDENNTTITITPNIRPLIDMLSYYVARAKIQAHGIGKIIVTFSNTHQHTDQYEELLDVTIIKTNSPLNIQELNTLPPDELREKHLLRIYEPIHHLFQQKNISPAPLEQVLQLIKSKHFIFEELWQSKWNPARTTQATIRWRYKKRIHFYLDLFQKNEKTTQNILITTAAFGLGLIQLCLGHKITTSLDSTKTIKETIGKSTYKPKKSTSFTSQRFQATRMANTTSPSII